MFDDPRLKHETYIFFYPSTACVVAVVVPEVLADDVSLSGCVSFLSLFLSFSGILAGKKQEEASQVRARPPPRPGVVCDGSPDRGYGVGGGSLLGPFFAVAQGLTRAGDPPCAFAVLSFRAGLI